MFFYIVYSKKNYLFYLLSRSCELCFWEYLLDVEGSHSLPYV